jgi:uncharacterized protein (DUF1501 family)
MAKLSRRDFVLATTFSTAALSLTTRSAVGQMVGTPAPFSDYRALVCVFLFGGNDSFNMLVPRSDAEYNAYAASRTNLAIAKDQLLPISPLVRDGADYGLHPSMGELQALFESGSVAFVTNVGPLLEPVTKEAYRAYTVALPPQLYSHNDQQDQWHALRGHSPSKSGWAGRIADLLRANVTDQQLALNVSLSGNSLFQSGDQTVSYVMGPAGPLAFQRFGATGLARERRLAFERVLAATYDSIYARGFVDVQQRALQSADRVTAALATAPTLTTTFPTTPLGQQLATVARIIAARDRLEMHRQIFFVATGGFDSHDNQVTDQPLLLGNVSAALAAFYRATKELGVASSVTAFTQSDFGRTLTSNGDGTDHAWGGNQIVVGDAVRGRMLYGRYPSLQLNGPDDTGNGGRMIPTTSADQYAATLAKWFGVPDADLDLVAPHLQKFTQRDLGFLL